MRHIPIDKLPEVYNSIKGEGAFEVWKKQAEIHLSNLKTLSKAERAIYWNKNNHWKELYPALSKLSGNKCWYSESPENSSEWEIDHFRPKGQSRNENKLIIRDDGYWWLSYQWRNFRLAGSLVNKLRKDRFGNGNDVFGKGDFFPLEERSIVAEPGDVYCRDEQVLLLDPIKPRDCSLIAFDGNGEVYPVYSKEENSLRNKKSVLSIKHYGLYHSPLKRARKKIWDKCDSIVDITNNYLKTYLDDEPRREDTIDDCYLKLAELSYFTEPYSMVVKSFIKTKAKDSNYEWLENALMVLQ